MSVRGGEVVVITGAGSGIGRALALEFDARGCRLALSDIDRDAVEEVAAGCRAARAHHLDVSDRDAVLAHAAQVVDDLGGVEIVVNNAGVALAADAEQQSFEDLDWLLGVDLHGVINSTQAFLPHLIASGGGHLVTISSVFGLMAMPSQSAYNAAKYGVRGYTEAIAIEMDVNGHPVQVHCVHPGGIRTNIANAARKAPGRDSQVLTDLMNRYALRTSPEAAARAIVRGIDRGRRRILVGADAHVLHVAERVLGPHYQPLVAAGARRLFARFATAGQQGSSSDLVDAG